MRPALCIVAATLGPILTPAAAHDAPCQDGLARAFDFWAGEWEVFTPDGRKAGDNVITIEEDGCLLVERWTSAAGGTGQSYNYVDLETNEWRQVWVSGGMTIDYQGGPTADGDMVLTGTIAYRDGRRRPFRGTWTANADGTVTQSLVEKDEASGEWAPWFTGLYRPRASAEAE